MNVRQPSKGLNRWVFPLVGLANAIALADLYLQGYTLEELMGYAAIMMIIMYEYWRE